MKSQIEGMGASTRKFVSQLLQAQYSVPGAFNQARPVTDPQNQTAASLLSFNQTARIVHGFITDCTAIGNAYRVQLEKNKQTVVGYLAPRTSCNLFGARELTTLQPGTNVTCIWHEHFSWAQIIAVVPPVGLTGAKNHHAILHGASRGRVDEAHKTPFRMADGGYIPAFLAGRPYDATNVGEAGWVTETGVKAFVDSFMAMFGVEESCQISFHYHDMLARISAYNLQVWTACREHESFNDQDETLDWTGYAMYPWEQMGLAARADPTQIRTAEQWQVSEPHYSKMEPLDDNLMPWHREREFHGYLGQGGKRCVVAPPVEFEDNGNKGGTGGTDIDAGSRTQFTSYIGGSSGVGATHPGLFDSSVTADGRLLIQSAKGISLVKRAAIMLPTRLRRPEDPDGDTDTSYKASGILGDGADHAITGDIETSGEHTGFNRAMGIMDMHAYFFNYAGVHPFFYHTNDYALGEESQASWTGNKSEEVPDFNRLAVEAYINPDDYKKTWKIDHRYGEQSFYTLSCGFELLDDGGVMITDGYGGSIRMTGGSIEISAPGDVWLKSGRNTNLWAGADLIGRCKNSFDITATNGDGRIKADKNIMVLGGNAGTGGVLIESRGAGDFDFDECGERAVMAGIVLRAPVAPIVTWSPEIYLRTNGPGISGGRGSIVFDADQGQGSIAFHSAYQNHYIDSGVFWHFDGLENNGRPSAMLTSTGTVWPGTMCVVGGIIADGNSTFNGVVSSTKSFVAVNCPFVGCLTPEDVGRIEEVVARCRELAESEIPGIGFDYLDAVLIERFYNPGRPGNDDVILKGEFSYRVQQDYKTENFMIYEDRWQQLGRLTGKAGAQWFERVVTCQGNDTYPYPGKEAFTADDNFLQQDLTIFSAVNGRANDRGSSEGLAAEYAEPKFSVPTKASLNDYTVIR